ncbi:hypothetical protein IFT48_00110 [Pseudomonas fluorescens]|uniref:exodeoxyribonuclease VII small subunit n=1 Tax=Pseudomonas TaxID=286 RepID=UPI000F014584|nr:MULTISPECIES: exodeoxyribonuclease VII small subunit [Pseudomonas]MBD8088395.1 hypothetical protein [Pseudomonas fluorescens]MBD8615159.1 hypothetical protein [Pseudomonas putida]MBD8681166.1 hypothetical protein [Pseudomonas sp. CFBP 13719]
MTDSTVYMDNIRRLQNSVKTLAEMPEPDVDQILPLIEAGSEAYRQVKSRIQLVREGLAKARGDVES